MTISAPLDWSQLEKPFFSKARIPLTFQEKSLICRKLVIFATLRSLAQTAQKVFQRFFGFFQSQKPFHCTRSCSQLEPLHLEEFRLSHHGATTSLLLAPVLGIPFPRGVYTTSRGCVTQTSQLRTIHLAQDG